jgi:hypothetical protein
MFPLSRLTLRLPPHLLLPGGWCILTPGVGGGSDIVVMAADRVASAFGGVSVGLHETRRLLILSVMG